jgi:hypothetical protein
MLATGSLGIAAFANRVARVAAVQTGICGGGGSAGFRSRSPVFTRAVAWWEIAGKKLILQRAGPYRHQGNPPPYVGGYEPGLQDTAAKLSAILWPRCL